MGTWRLDKIPASSGKAISVSFNDDDFHFVRDSQTSSSTEAMIQGHMLIVIPAPESVKKNLASSESSRKPLMDSMMSPVSRLLCRPLLSARDNRKSSETVR